MRSIPWDSRSSVLVWGDSRTLLSKDYYSAAFGTGYNVFVADATGNGAGVDTGLANCRTWLNDPNGGGEAAGVKFWDIARFNHGVHSAGYTSAKVYDKAGYAEGLRQIIDIIREHSPSADIYVCNTFEVPSDNSDYATAGPVLTEFNQAIDEQQNRWITYVEDEDGYYSTNSPGDAGLGAAADTVDASGWIAEQGGVWLHWDANYYEYKADRTGTVVSTQSTNTQKKIVHCPANKHVNIYKITLTAASSVTIKFMNGGTAFGDSLTLAAGVPTTLDGGGGVLFTTDKGSPFGIDLSSWVQVSGTVSYEYGESPESDDLTAGLVAFYPLDGSDTPLLKDTTKTSSLDLTNNGSIATARQIAFIGSEFDGSTQYFSNSSTAWRPDAGPFTICALVHCTNSGGDNYVGGHGSGKMYFRLDNDGRIVCNLPLSSNAFTSPATATSVYPFDDAWHHVAYVWEGDGSGTPATANARVYLDGREVTSSSATSFTNEGFSSFVGSLTIGRTNASLWHTGFIKNYGFWTAALTPAQIYKLYQGHIPGA